MRAIVRVLPLFAAAALFAACAANHAAVDEPGAPRAAVVASPASPAPAKAPRARPDQAPPRLLSSECELAKPPEGVPPEQAHAAQLDYEQQCYKQLAQSQHARLTALQDVAAKRSVAAEDRALLERQPPPHCDPTKPEAGLSPVAAREATLDAARQCYKQAEANERQKLDALQDALRKTGQRGNGEARPPRRDRYMSY
jgi:hypothetical protein